MPVDEYGDPFTLPVDSEMPWGILHHKSPNAGKHRDFRFGPNQLYSFATKKDIPTIGSTGAIRLYQTPLHGPEHLHIKGKTPYGVVTPERKGRLRVTKIDKNHMTFTVRSGNTDEQFVLIRDPKSPRGWLLKNITPIPVEEPVPVEKVAYWLGYRLGRLR